DIIYSLFGREVANRLRQVSRSSGDLKVEGFAGEPSLNRGNRNGELCFVNGRYVKSPLLMKAIEQAYHGLTMQHKFPLAVLQIQMKPELIDVNVHPQKTEVRFREEKAVFDLVYYGIRDALFSRDLIPKETIAASPKEEVSKQPETEAKKQPAAEEINQSAAEANPLPESPGPERPRQELPVFRETTDYRTEADRRLLDEILSRPRAEEAMQQTLFEEKIIRPEKADSFRLIGQLFDTYWLLEYENWLLLADQHAVHEKILFERTMRSLKEKEATTQRLMPPLILSLNGAQQETLQRFEQAFLSLGFEIEALGGREFRLDGVPDNLFSLSGRELFLHMLDELSEERVSAPAMLEEKVALMSCKAAVKGNDPLDRKEAEALFQELMKLENPYTCPHGRPTMIRMSRTELEKKFKRIV
ncbi:MAG: DNA mismatch repair protein MutL, partial [Lachnospiraceae bacterium]|nr:DNA mismatch repair protein MutL [Lachnospiraceae bacterium]